MSKVPQSEQNKRAWVTGWVDGANGQTSRTRQGFEGEKRNFYDEGRSRGAAARDRAMREAKLLFEEDKS